LHHLTDSFIEGEDIENSTIGLEEGYYIQPHNTLNTIPNSFQKIVLFNEDEGIHYRATLSFNDDELSIDPTSYEAINPTSNYYDICEVCDNEMRRENIRTVVENNWGFHKHVKEYIEEAFFHVPLVISRSLINRDLYFNGLNWLRTVYDYTLPEKKRKIYYGLVKEEGPVGNNYFTMNWADKMANPTDVHSTASSRPNAYSQFTIQTIIQALLTYADSEFTSDTPESLERALILYEQALELLEAPELKPNGANTYGSFPIPQNPIFQMLRFHAENNLHKIRTCRNIAGIKREVETYGAATDVLSAMPSIGPGGQLVLPTSILPPPVPYRYEFLIDRAKQLVSIAGQMETAFLSALEKRDAERYAHLKARQDLQIARSGVKLQNLRLRQATNEEDLAELT